MGMPGEKVTVDSVSYGRVSQETIREEVMELFLLYRNMRRR